MTSPTIVWKPRAASPRPRPTLTTVHDRPLLPAVALFAALVVVPLATVGLSSTREFRPGGPVLEVEMRASAGEFARLFTAAGKEWWVEGDRVAIAGAVQGFDRVRFVLPRRPLELLRLHPTDAPGSVVIRRMRVIDAAGETAREIDPAMMVPLNHVAQIAPDAEGTGIVTIPAGNDPALLLRAAWLAPPPDWWSIRFVTPLSLAWIACAVVTLMAAGLGMLLREAARHGFGLPEALWMAALMAGVFAARLALLYAYPSPVPFWDQWDAEGAFVYLPWSHDALAWRHMFTFHNEHRIFFSRLLALALLLLNQQWDPLLQMVVNAGLYAVTAVALALVVWLQADRQRLPLIALITGMVFAPPFAWENSLAGFQSAFYFFVYFSVLAFWLMGCHRPGSVRWMLGWLYAVCALFTVAGGAITTLAIAAAVVFRTVATPHRWRASVVTLAALVPILAIAYASASPALPHHAELKAQTVYTFFAAFARNLAFPWSDEPRASVFVWLPVLWLTGLLLARRVRPSPLEGLVFTLIVWVTLQAGAVAYTRGVGGRAPASRYLDTLGFVLVANSLALVALRQRLNTSRARQHATRLLVVYLVSASAGLAWLSYTQLNEGTRERAQWMRQYVRSVREFLRTDDIGRFTERRAPQEVPYFSPAMLGNWLRHPYVRSILPAAIREPVRLEARAVSTGWSVSLSDGEPVWDSYSRFDEGRGRFESEPIACPDTGWLRLQVAGALTEPGLSLALEPVASGARRPVRPDPFRRRGWIDLASRCPQGPFSIVAVDDAPQSWFAFREPRAIGWLSVWAARMISTGGWLAALASAACAIAAATWRGRPRRPSGADAGARAKGDPQ